MNYKLAIFDLDGTLLDTLEDLEQSLNAALLQNALPPRTLEEVRRFVGNGIRKLVERGVPGGTDKTVTDKVYNDFCIYYAKHNADYTYIYNGIPELLTDLRNAGCRLAVLSNKADNAVQALCNRFFKGMFDMVAGAKDKIPKKPAPDGVLEILKALGVQKEEAVYIGDSEVDIETAENAGLRSVIVDWGFRDRAVLIARGADHLVSSCAKLKTEILNPKTF